MELPDNPFKDGPFKDQFEHDVKCAIKLGKELLEIAKVRTLEMAKAKDGSNPTVIMLIAVKMMNEATEDTIQELMLGKLKEFLNGRPKADHTKNPRAH